MSESVQQQPSDGTAPVHDADTSRGRMLAEISNAMVHLYKEDFGRGPTRASTRFAGPDALICILRETFTRAERRLIEMGEHERMRETRLMFQHASGDRFRGAVEHITGRRVQAFISGTDTKQDVSLEYFLLAPQGDGRPGA